MSRDPRYDILFEPVPIGPVTARNRFYQVPHCNGMGYRDPTAMATMRGIKAQGGWAVVCTEQTEIHHTSDISPFSEGRLWDEQDLPVLERMAEHVHAHDSLAGIELCHNGMSVGNYYTREIPMSASHLPVITDYGHDPIQARAMTKRDIADLRGWHRNAAQRARQAGFDIIYVYAAHALGLPFFFLSRRYNHRCDEYGGSLENRVRLLRELIDDTKDAVGDSCAVAVRVSVDELTGDEGLDRNEARDAIALIGDLPDLWDLTLSDWSNDSQTSRFSAEGNQEPFVESVRAVTSKPIVGVGRFTSPDTMVSQVRRGILDFIGAARPSIADPFLPKKIEEGRPEDIRECIGCNMCVAYDEFAAPIRCTQNPTMGEEWRRGWHPERIAPAASEARVLVVGGGPAGLECARALGQRGYSVTLSERSRQLGGRVTLESALPGLSAWARVRDYRLGQLEPMRNVEIYRESSLGVDDVLEFASEHVVIATGATWRRDGVGRSRLSPLTPAAGSRLLTPEDVMESPPSAQRILVFDDDHYYLGGVLAEHLVKAGNEIVFVTPAAQISAWTTNTLEQHVIQRHLLELDVEVHPHRTLADVGDGKASLQCVFTERTESIDCDAVLLVTARLPRDELFHSLEARRDACRSAGISSMTAIGDAYAPGTIAAAVYWGHRFARELDAKADTDRPPFRRERVALVQEPLAAEETPERHLSG